MSFQKASQLIGQASESSQKTGTNTNFGNLATDWPVIARDTRYAKTESMSTDPRVPKPPSHV